MITLTPSQISALNTLSIAKTAAQQATWRCGDYAKMVRRAQRFAKFEATTRDGLRYSRNCARRKSKSTGNGGGLSEFRLRQILP